MRLIDSAELIAKLPIVAEDKQISLFGAVADVVTMISECKPVDAVELPCKIGDYAWAIRNYHGHKHPQRGVVSDMYFTRDMQLHIVVKRVARGKWGETVFATDADAYAVINGGQAQQKRRRDDE